MSGIPPEYISSNLLPPSMDSKSYSQYGSTAQDTKPVLNSLTYDYYTTTKGTGINVKPPKTPEESPATRTAKVVPKTENMTPSGSCCNTLPSRGQNTSDLLVPKTEEAASCRVNSPPATSAAERAAHLRFLHESRLKLLVDVLDGSHGLQRLHRRDDTSSKPASDAPRTAHAAHGRLSDAHGRGHQDEPSDVSKVSLRVVGHDGRRGGRSCSGHHQRRTLSSPISRAREGLHAPRCK